MNSNMEHLLSDVGDLLTRLSHVKNRDIARVRDKVQDTLESARDSLTDTAASLGKQGSQGSGQHGRLRPRQPLAGCRRRCSSRLCHWLSGERKHPVKPAVTH